MIYLIVLLLLVYCIYRYDYCQIRHGRLLMWVVLCIILICVAGFRYRMGTDTQQYSHFYDKVPRLSELRLYYFQNVRYAPGFVLLASICKTISSELMVLQFAEAIIVDTVVFYFFWKNTRHIFFAALLFYVLMYLNLNMEVMREAIAVSFFLMAWPFMVRGAWLKYYFMVLCAMMFHVSAYALLILPVIFVPGIRYFFSFGTRTWVFCALCLIIGLTAGYFFFNFIRAIALTETMVDRSNAYSDTDLGGLKTMNISGLVSRIVRYVLYPAVAMFFLNKLKGTAALVRDVRLQKIESLTIASIYVSLLSCGLFIFQRYNNYLFFFPILMMSDWIFSVLKVGYRKMRLGFGAWILIFFPLFLLSLVTYYLKPVNREGTLRTYMIYYPYKDAFDKETDHDRERVLRYLHRR